MFRVPKIHRVDLRLTPIVRTDTTMEQMGRVAKIDSVNGMLHCRYAYGSSAVTINVCLCI